VQREGHGDVEIRLRHFQTGEPLWFYYYLFSVHDAAGQAIGWATVSRDITERRKAEAEIRQRAQELAALNALGRQVGVSLSPERVIATALEETFATARPDLAFFFLREGERLILNRLVPEDAHARLGEIPEHRIGECMCGLAISQGKALYSRDIFADLRCTWDECKKAGFRSFAALPLRSGDDFVGVLGLASNDARDFERQAEFLETLTDQIAIGLQNAFLFEQTRRHAAELEQRVAERTAQLVTANKDLESFSYSVSHDLRAPLRAINGFAAIVARRHRASLNAEGQHYVDNVVQASERMGRLIDDLLTYARLGRQGVRREPAPLRDVLAPLASDLSARMKEIGGTLAIADDLPTVPGDRTLLSQIFTNLLENAVTYRKPDAPLQVTINWQIAGNDVIIRVHDNGIGIPPEHHEKIFNVFQRLHSEDEYPGTGIGLATVKKSVELLGGKVWVESVVGEGSTFFIQLQI
jgi:signal transduction histidine kinase